MMAFVELATVEYDPTLTLNVALLLVHAWPQDLPPEHQEHSVD